MPEDGEKVADGKKVAIGAGIVAAGVGIFLLVKKVAVPPEVPIPPTPPTPPVGLSNIYGVVVDSSTGEILTDVRIVLNGYPETSTSLTGEYYFYDIEPGPYIISFAREGYLPFSEEVTVKPGNNEISVELEVLEVPPEEEEPPLPTPGIGMPTDEEIEAVKATVRFRLDHIGWGVCADIHYTPEMNNLLLKAIAPLEALKVRIGEETIRRKEECLGDSVEQWRATRSEIIRRWQLCLNFDYRKYCPCGFRYGYCYDWDKTGVWMCNEFNLATRRPIEEVLRIAGIWEYWVEGGCHMGEYQPVCTKYWDRIQGLDSGMSLKQDQCRQDGLIRKGAMLDYAYWYCGFPLGY